MKNTQTSIVRKSQASLVEKIHEKHRKIWIKNTQTSIVRKSHKLQWLGKNMDENTKFTKKTKTSLVEKIHEKTHGA